MNRISVTILIVLTLVMGVISGCLQQQNNNIPEQTTSILKGVSLSPRSFHATDFTDFFNKTRATGEIVSWTGDWNELSNTENGGPVVVASLVTISSHRYVPVIEAQFFTQSNGTLLRPLNSTTKQRYENSAVAFATTFTPSYLALGVEINVLYEKSPQDFEEFVTFFGDVYTAVKAVSPETNVFTIFQLEKMKGLQDGLFGGVNNPDTAQWSLLDRFPDSDLIAFTTYPSLIYTNPSDIPSDYYTEITAHTTKPVVFTEIGWPSNTSIPGWGSNEAQQATFIPLFFNLTKEVNPEFVIWSFMYDQNTIEPFKSMGLRRDDGSAKPSWDAWTQAGQE
ncbi:MAG: hypothetical protein V1726_00975 [Methanobacteriota archaeon]